MVNVDWHVPNKILTAPVTLCLCSSSYLLLYASLEVLKQVWDLSDQDNDSMLSLREFCIALYLIERCREGRPLPAVLPTSIIFEGVQFPAPGQTASSVSNASWRPAPGIGFNSLGIYNLL